MHRDLSRNWPVTITAFIYDVYRSDKYLDISRNEELQLQNNSLSYKFPTYDDNSMVICLFLLIFVVEGCKNVLSTFIIMFLRILRLMLTERTHVDLTQNCRQL